MRIPAIFVCLVLGLFALGMAYLLVLGFRNVYRGFASESWPTASGQVGRVEMSTSTTRNSNGRGSSTMYRTQLTIRYEAAGDSYTTDQVTWGQTLGSGDASEATLLALRYPEGRRVRVSYNPNKPYEAVVRPGITGSAFLLPGAALIFLLFLVPAIPMSWRILNAASSSHAEAPGMRGMIGPILMIPILMGLGLAVPGMRNLWHGWASKSWPTVPGAWMSENTLEPAVSEASPTPLTGVSSTTPSADANASPADNPPNAPTDTGGNKPDANSAPSDAAAPEPAEAKEEPPKLRDLEYVYRYTVNGQVYFNTMRWFGQGPAGANHAEVEIERDFPRNQPLQVHYNPVDPELSTLATGIRGFAWILPGAGIGFMLFGVAGMWVALKS